ncbi:VRR-NUC domain-containing protein [Pseudomonas cavernicola]|uniref:VRR-NUC domain-containing protein n=1 Tax=Pseudomonas cavernicola TaxID=2320866 RepID=A0A418XFD1_9PSED|nr:VRR-NUC domain-containing protein [Pseudomonas cavernicola]
MAKVADLIPFEEDDQIALIQWFDRQYPALAGRLASSSGGARMTMRTAKRQKAAGNRKGFPDLNLLTPRHGFSGLVIELKRVRGGRLEPEQADWLEWLAEQGFMAVVCKGFDAARDTIKGYLGEGTPCN